MVQNTKNIDIEILMGEGIWTRSSIFVAPMEFGPWRKKQQEE
jgi:hypothetical protein